MQCLSTLREHSAAVTMSLSGNVLTLRHPTETGQHHPFSVRKLGMPSHPQQPVGGAIQVTLDSRRVVHCHQRSFPRRSNDFFNMSAVENDRVTVDTALNNTGLGNTQTACG